MYYNLSNCQQPCSHPLFAFCIIRAPIPVAVQSKRDSAAACLLGLRIRVPLENGCLSVVSVECCQVGFSVTGQSLLQRSPTESGLSDSV
jgi:hypothetical protein